MQTVRDNQDLMVKTYEHLVSGVITENEYHIFKGAFNNKVVEAENNITMLRKELDNLSDNSKVMEHVERFKTYGNLKKLTRRIIVTLLKSIIVQGNKEVIINLRYTNAAEFTPAPLDVPPAHGKVVA